MYHIETQIAQKPLTNKKNSHYKYLGKFFIFIFMRTQKYGESAAGTSFS